MKPEARSRWRRVVSCVNKVRYRDLDDAKRAKARYMRRRPDAPLRAYDCPHCGGWHLTRQT
jgi:hypothetical protein